MRRRDTAHGRRFLPELYSNLIVSEREELFAKP